jgi:hypothetical protein
MRCSPLPWVAFVLYVMVILSGFDFYVPGAIHAGLFLAFLDGIAMFYIILFIESWNVVLYRRIQETWKKDGLHGALNFLPRWLLTFLMALAAGTIFIFTSLEGTQHLKWLFLVGTILCFALRDAGLLHYFRLSPTSRRPEFAAVFYLSVLYLLIPWLFKAMHLYTLTRIFWPMENIVSIDDDSLILSLMFSILQAFVAWALVLRRWKQNWQVMRG